MRDMNSKNELTIFNYGLNKVRTIIKDGLPWFVLKDVCDVLELRNATQVADRLEDDERSMLNIGRQGNINIINESGLYNVILRSDKPEAKRFKRWITHEVLPSIRKTGAYIQTPKTYIEALEALIQKEKEKEALEEERKALLIELDESREYYTVKRVAKMNGINWRDIEWKKLKNTSQAMECEVKRIFDANYGNVNAYHIDVWRHEYPHLRYI